MTKAGLLIVFSGPSGVGKDTVLRYFLKQREDCVLSVSATTRDPRPGETEGVDYFYITQERFDELVARGEMLEYAQYGGNFYGTPRQAVDDQLQQGYNVILEIEVQGARQIRKLRPDAVFVFVMPPSWNCLATRLKNRGTESAEALQNRLDLARSEIQNAMDYDYILINDDVERCAKKFDAVVTAARCSSRHMQDFIREVFSHA